MFPARDPYAALGTPVDAKKPTTVSGWTKRYGKTDPAVVRREYEKARESLVRGITDPRQRRARLIKFDSDPRAQAMRKVAGLAPLSTPKREVQEVARKTRQEKIKEAGRRAAQTEGVPDWAIALKAGITRSMFGIPERLAAAGLKYLPSSVTGNTSDLSYDELLEAVRAKTDAELGQSTTGNVLGQIAGSVLSGSAAGKAIVQGSTRLASSAVPAAQRVGNVLQNLTRLRQGERARNTAKIVGTGAVAGGAQAAGEGADVGEGALYGAGGAAAFSGAFKGAELLTRPVRDVFRITGAETFLRRFTRARPEDLTRRAAEIRRQRGAEPSLFEVLPLRDQNNLLRRVVGDSPEIVEHGNRALAARLAALPEEMRRTIRQATREPRRNAQRSLIDDLASARGEGSPPTGSGDARAAIRATEDPTHFQNLYRQEARLIMEPHDASRVVDSIDDLLVSAPGQRGGSRVDLDPEVNRQIRAAARPFSGRNPEEGIRVEDLTDMVSDLMEESGRAGTMAERRSAEAAANHLMGVIEQNVPEAAEAATRMRAAFAAKSRMAEGMRAGFEGQRRSTTQTGTSRKAARLVENAFETPEGTTGRMLGQSNRLLDELGGSQVEAMRATRNMAEGSTARGVTENLGREPGRRVLEAARSQAEGQEALARAARHFQANERSSAAHDELRNALVSLHPSTFITARISALNRLLKMTYLPDNRARTIVDMLFSQDPNLTGRAISALRRERGGLLFLGALPGMLASDGVSEDTEIPTSEPELDGTEPLEKFEEESTDVEQPEVVEEDEYAAYGAPPFGEQAIRSVFPEAEFTDTLRDPDSDLGRANPDSYHNLTEGAADIRPIPGITFEEYIQRLKDAGYKIIEARDEVNNPSRHATGPHWHVVLG